MISVEIQNGGSGLDNIILVPPNSGLVIQHQGYDKDAFTIFTSYLFSHKIMTTDLGDG